MTNGYQKLFQKLELVQPPMGLEGKIIGAIRRHQRRASRLKLIRSGFLFYLSGFLSIFAIQFVSAELAASGFFQYLSVMFSEGTNLLPLWKEFALVIAESAPIWGLALICGAVFTLLASLKLIFNQNYELQRIFAIKNF